LVSANLYFEKINFSKYFGQTDCRQCGFPCCVAFLEALKSGGTTLHQCPFILRNQTYAFETVGRMKDVWPEVPLLVHPRPGYTGLIELNNPNQDSIVLITGNNEYTEQILMTVLETTICPFYVLCVNTEGNTVDMSMVYKTLTAMRIREALEEAGSVIKAQNKEMIIPGLASSLRNEIERSTGLNVRVGPECAAELPLFLSDIWIPPQ
jgi:CO dehydrogenase/acetyl-CoA synthase gamma subunit (corrinoid Fe-S protein)